MNLTVKDTNVIILYGDGATGRFSEMMNRWVRLIASSQWDNFYFILAGPTMPELNLDEAAASLVNGKNSRFFRVCTTDTDDVQEDAYPDAAGFYNIIYDHLITSNVRLHILCDTAGQALPYDWLKGFVRSAMAVNALNATCIYYLMFGRNSLPAEQNDLISLLQEVPGSTILLGDANEHGGRIAAEDRANAAELAILLNCANVLPLSRKAYSLGYSALNANGSELTILSESVACRALTEELARPITSLTEAEMLVELLPAGVDSVSGLREWLRQYAYQNAPQPKPVEWKNALITVRINSELTPQEALKRMQRFADLNYADGKGVRSVAESLARQTYESTLNHLCNSPVTACLSPSVLTEISTAFRRLTAEDIQPAGCAWPPKNLKARIGLGNAAETYEKQCCNAVVKSIRDYISERCIAVLAGELARVYERLAGWLREIRGESEFLGRRQLTVSDLLGDIQKELDSPESGNAAKLSQKYDDFARELESIHPSLSTLTENAAGTYFTETSAVNEPAWRKLIHIAGQNMDRKMDGRFRGDFFKILSAELSTPEEREAFFNEYLKSGPRMYSNLHAVSSTGTVVFLADNRLTDKWFMERELYEVKTDNAENVTLYPLGDEDPVYYLKDTTVFFNGYSTSSSGGGRNLFSTKAVQTGKAESSGSSLFGDHEASPDEQKPAASSSSALLRLEPDGKGAYRLYWKWKGNDATAMIEIRQDGERIGHVTVIPAQKFKANGDSLNVTDDIFDGKPIPAGTLHVTIRDASQEIIFNNVPVMGRRDVIKYKVNGRQLQLKPDNPGIVSKVTLRTTDSDGTRIYYPLYRGPGDTPWLYEGLALSDGKLVTDPSLPNVSIWTMKMYD